MLKLIIFYIYASLIENHGDIRIVLNKRQEIQMTLAFVLPLDKEVPHSLYFSFGLKLLIL